MICKLMFLRINNLGDAKNNINKWDYLLNFHNTV